MKTRTLGAALVATGVIVVSGSITALATQGQSICHPVEGQGETKNGWVIEGPDKASSHIDENIYPADGYWKHETKDGRHDQYVDAYGHCPGYVPPTETVTPTPSATPSDTSTPTPTEGTPTPTVTPSSPTVTPTPTPSNPTPTPSSPTPTPTDTGPNPSITPSTGTPTPTPTRSTPVVTPTPTSTYTRSVTPTPTDVPSDTPTPTATSTVIITHRLAQTGNDWIIPLGALGLALTAAGGTLVVTAARKREH